MNLTCKGVPLLLFACLVVDTSTGRKTLTQNLVGGNHHTWTNALLKTLAVSSSLLPAASLGDADIYIENRPKKSNSPAAQIRGHSGNQSIIYSNAFHALGVNDVSKVGMLLDLLKYVRSSVNIHRNVPSQTDSHVPQSSLPSNTTGSVEQEVNRKEAPHIRSLLNMTTAYPVSVEASTPNPKRNRRGSYPILPDVYVDRQSYYSSSETCSQQELMHVLRPPGCLRRVVATSSCQGTCHSRSVSQWDIALQQLRHVAYCTCCKPHQLTYRRTTFRCPGRQRRMLVMYVGVATQCACRPCAEADPALQQPYDY